MSARPSREKCRAKWDGRGEIDEVEVLADADPTFRAPWSRSACNPRRSRPAATPAWAAPPRRVPVGGHLRSKLLENLAMQEFDGPGRKRHNSRIGGEILPKNREYLPNFSYWNNAERSIRIQEGEPSL
jgi:hypothetical protein